MHKPSDRNRCNIYKRSKKYWQSKTPKIFPCKPHPSLVHIEPHPYLIRSAFQFWVWFTRIIIVALSGPSACSFGLSYIKQVEDQWRNTRWVLVWPGSRLVTPQGRGILYLWLDALLSSGWERKGLEFIV